MVGLPPAEPRFHFWFNCLQTLPRVMCEGSRQLPCYLHHTQESNGSRIARDYLYQAPVSPRKACVREDEENELAEERSLYRSYCKSAAVRGPARGKSQAGEREGAQRVEAIENQLRREEFSRGRAGRQYACSGFVSQGRYEPQYQRRPRSDAVAGNCGRWSQ